MLFYSARPMACCMGHSCGTSELLNSLCFSPTLTPLSGTMLFLCEA